MSTSSRGPWVRGGERDCGLIRGPSPKLRVLDESQDLKFSCQEIAFWKINIRNNNSQAL